MSEDRGLLTFLAVAVALAGVAASMLAQAVRLALAPVGLS